MMVEKINKFIEESGLTDEAAAKYFGISKKYLYAIRARTVQIDKPLWGRLNRIFGCDMLRPYAQKDLNPPAFTPPAWVLAAPEAIRPYIEQEYFVDPDRAKYFLENARTYGDIKELRCQNRQMNGYGESTINLMEMEA